MCKKKRKRLPKELSLLIKSKPLKKTGQKGELKRMRKKEIEKARFRVCCIHPVVDIQGGAIKLQSTMHRLCGYGHGMTIKEMNKNLIWKGQPYIRIPYCKYCYNENTIGVFDDAPQILGWVIYPPTKESPVFRLGKMPEDGFRRYREELKKKYD